MGTEKESFIELTERIGRKTGGLSVYPFTSAKRGQTEPIAYLMVGYTANSGRVVSAKCCAVTIATMFQLLVHAVLSDSCA